MHRLRIQNLEESETTSRETYPSQVETEKEEVVLELRLFPLEDLFLPDFAESLTFQFHCRSYDFVRLLFDCLSFYGFSADTSRQ